VAGVWVPELIAAGQGSGEPFGSLDPDDVTPRIRYIPNIATTSVLPAWREIDNPAVGATFITPTGLYIYYTQQVSRPGRSLILVIHRCDSG